MYLNTLVALGFPLFASLARASREAYDEICPSRDGQTEQRDGAQIAYHCNRRLPADSLLDTRSADTPEACIEHCKTEAQCTGSQWLYSNGECRLFTASDDNLEYLRASLVTIVTRNDEEPPVEPESPGDDAASLEECRTSLDDCGLSERRLEQELEECRASSGNGEEEATLAQELETCENSRIVLQRQLRTCERTCETDIYKLMTLWGVCPAKDNQTVRQGRGTFKFNCKVKRTGTVLATTAQGFEMCLQSCALKSECKGVNYWKFKPIHQRCEMFKGPKVGYTGTTEEVVAALLTARH